MNRRDLIKRCVATALFAGCAPAEALFGLPGGAAVAGIPNTYGLGIHLGGIAYYNGQLPFLNVFLPGTWITAINGGTFDTGEEAYLPLDSNGWPTAISASGKTFNMTRKLINYNIKTASYTGLPYPAHSASADGSSYTLQAQGAGTIVLAQDVDHNSLSTSSPGVTIGGANGTTITSTAAAGVTWSVTFGVTTPNTGIDFQLQSTDPGQTGNNIKNVTIFETRYASNVAAGQYFNPLWLSLISQFSCARFMDWLQTNSQTPAITLSAAVGNGVQSAALLSPWSNPSGQYRFFFDQGDTRVVTCTAGQTGISWTGVTSKAGSTTTAYCSLLRSVVGWSSRLSTSYATYSCVPWEVICALCNAANMDGWIVIPHGMQYADIVSLATYFRNNLNSNLRLYIEGFGNEVWNGAFNGSIFAQWMGENLWPDYASRGYSVFDVQLNYAGYQCSQTAAAFASVYGADYGTRCRVVVGGQAANTAVADSKLKAPLAVAEGTLAQAPYLLNKLDVCIAPYFPVPYNVPPAWLTLPQSTALTNLFAQINTGGQIAGDGGASYLSAAYSQVTAHANLLGAAPYSGRGMLLLGYESGQNLVSAQNDSNVVASMSAWQANHSYGSGTVIVDSVGHAQQCTTGGASGGSAPAWNAAVGGATTDNTVTWTRVNNRAPPWQPNVIYEVGDPAVDSHGACQLCTTGGTSGSSAPAWSTTDQGTTADNAVTWTCMRGPNWGASSGDEYTALFAAANKDSRMGAAYSNYYAQWKVLGGTLLNAFVDISPYNKHGYWGAAEDLEQLVGVPLASTPPKWQSMVGFSTGTPKWW